MLAFIHIAKTAGRSVETMLRSSYGLRYVRAVPWRPYGRGRAVAKYDVEDFRRLRRLWRPMTVVGGHAVALWSGFHELEPVRYFAFLREPLARAASHYQFHLTTEADPLDWDAWLAWNLQHNHQTRAFSRDSDAAEAIAAVERHGVFLGLLEEFDASLLMLRRLVAPDLNPAYVRTNVARDRSAAADLLADPVRRSQLEAVNAEDLRFYRHVRETVFPRQQAKYGADLALDTAAFGADPARGWNRLNDGLNRALHRFWIGPEVARHRDRAGG